MNYQKALRAFRTQKWDANRRGILFLLTLKEWITWWEAQLGPNWQDKRGHLKGQFVMSRPGDVGPYSLRNIRCIQSGENVSEAHKGKQKSEVHKQRIGAGRKGKKHSESAKMALRAFRLGTKQTEATKSKIGDKVKGELNPSAKLTEDQVRHIKSLIQNGLRNIEIKNLLKLEGIEVTHVQLSSIRHGTAWAHVYV